jgi:hypothetical protein
MTGCVNYISDLARYIGVCPKDLAEGVGTLKKQSEDALKAAVEGQRTQVEQERFKELEARNREMEKTLATVRGGDASTAHELVGHRQCYVG